MKYVHTLGRTSLADHEQTQVTFHFQLKEMTHMSKHIYLCHTSDLLY